MTFDEIKSKIESSTVVSITEIKDIPYGRCICLNNGGKVNCFNTGKYNVQGKGQEEVKAILEGNDQKIIVRYSLFTDTMKSQEHN